MKSSFLLALFLGLVALSSAKIYFSEKFGDGWDSRWVKSTNKEAEGSQGEWGLSSGKYNGNPEEKGLQTTQDARFYQISAEIPEVFSNKGKDLVMQYTVKHEQKIDCGGGYLKLHPAEGMDQKDYNGETPYNIMFGPDICGSATKKVHLIFNYKGKNHLLKKDVKCETDEFTHLYTLILHPDNTYQIKIDSKEVASGSLKEDWDLLPPKEIKDPQASKPADWVDEKMIPDPTDVKPAGWDDIPKEIPDTEATKPEDWDDELDGEWEAPMIDNPDYKGEWKPKMIENPAYKGEWVHPLIPNPDYYDDDNLYLYESNKYVGFELWQVKSGSIFDNILITDSIAEAEAEAEKVKTFQEEEKKVFEKAEEERKAREEEERKIREAEAAKAAENSDDDDDDDNDKAKDEL